ncbi:MAG TPA: SDR family NAD(P)-dependent oxidoreductase [Vicinamibacterales bacterium]|nr:SDR family NAD(P)-dependent oxidoreductase [Vicinamibacterales bacterium]
MTSYLVTGGGGFIGSALVRSLVRDGARVRVLDDASRGRVTRLADLERDVDLVLGDVRDPETVARAGTGIDAVVHLAAVNGTKFFYSMPDRVVEVGIKGMVNVLDMARRLGVGRVFVASSSEVYHAASQVPTDENVAMTIPDPLNPRYSYAASKIASEVLALSYGRRDFSQVVIFRPHNVYGPDMGWEHVIPELTLRIRALRRTSGHTIQLPIEGTGDETRAFAYVDDVVDGIRVLIDRGEHLGIYNLGTDVETRIDELAARIALVLGVRLEIVRGPLKVGSTLRRCPDISKARGLGFEPRVSLEEGLRRTVHWYDTHASERPAES